jgi:Bax protein
MRKQTVKRIKTFVSVFLIVISFVSSQAWAGDGLASKPVKQASLQGLPQKHQPFVQSVLNSTNKVNKSILQDRERLTKLHKQYQQDKKLSRSDEKWVYALATEYKVAHPNIKNSSTWNELNKRVDIVPASLVLAQAIQESGWGTSNLARNANNYFGQQCYHRGCGVKASHSPRSYHEMARYDSIHDAIDTYVHNLNSNHAYRKMRDIRFSQRQSNQKINSLALVNGLTAYSELGNRYVAKIKSVVSHLRLQRFDSFV